MQEKDIKRIVKKQLKKRFPNWNRLTKKEKKTLAKQVLEEVVSTYPFDKEITVPLNELTGTPAIRETEIMTLAEMEHFIADQNRNIFRFSTPSRKKYLKDPELRAIDKLLDNRIIDRLLAPEGYTPSMRTLFPSHMFRAELLKSLKYPEISYRKYCSAQLNNLEQRS